MRIWTATRGALAAVALLVAGTVGGAQEPGAAEGSDEMNEAATGPPVFHVLVHTPGPAWEPGVSFREQPGIEAHVGYMADLLEQGLLVMGGPFLDDSGGMMISRLPTLEEARRVAEADPAVRSGLLEVEVKRWLVPMSSVDPG